ncbi:NUDIX hydrolase [Comamonas faecalis]|uniref:NUDIX hydrolase n=1 Tax=Comamonas faecalis TaxID=1387849 RepID=A0ABP7RJX0_9BURK
MLYRPHIQFCNQCGAPVQYRVPDDGDTRERAICTACGTIQYENPLTVVGTVPVLGDQVLLCQRNIEPRKYKWTLPAGFMELGETVAEGAARETVEEAGAQFTLGALFTVMSVPLVGQVHIYHLARLHNDRFDPGHETIEARLFDEQDIPWEALAFRTVRHTLECFFADRRAGHFGVHTADMR